jgi:hypothetical protein
MIQEAASRGHEIARHHDALAPDVCRPTSAGWSCTPAATPQEAWKPITGFQPRPPRS